MNSLIVTNLKALVVVLGIAMVVFAVAKSACLQFMSETDFLRRRNLWLALTVVAFVSPSFWLFFLAAMVLLLFVGWRDPNPVALYVLLLHVIPINVGADIPVVVINQLFKMDWPRALALALLIPTVWRFAENRKAGGRHGLTDSEKMLLGYSTLVIVLLMPYESITNSMRRAFLLALDFLVLYYVVSRTTGSRRMIVETMACFCLACALAAPAAAFEWQKKWLLYAGLGDAWGSAIEFAFLLREDALRAQAAAGHALALGNAMAIGFGFWLYFRTCSDRIAWKLAFPVLAWVGLIAAYSRGPWVVAIAIVFAFLLLGPAPIRRMLQATFICALGTGILLVSPIGKRVLDNLPFIGTVGEETVDYRQRLAMASWELIQQNPLFGNPFVLTHLEDLRQGQGIIDLINTYARIAMFYGVVTLALYLGFFLVTAWAVRRAARGSSHDMTALGNTLIATGAGFLLMMAFGGYGQGIERMCFVVAGLGAAYARLATSGDSHLVVDQKDLRSQVDRTLSRA